MYSIQDVSTRWNFSYYAWDHLFYLKDAITRLQADLVTSTNREDKSDGNKLRKIILSEEEWELLDQLIDLLIPFENATQNFSGGTYVTLSSTISTIKKLIFDLAGNSLLDNININYLDENTVFETEIFTEELLIEIEDEEIISNISKRSVSIKNPLNTRNFGKS